MLNSNNRPDQRETQKRQSLARIDFRQLKAQVSIRQVLELYEWVPRIERSNGEARGPCPIHKSSSETSTIFAVNYDKNVFHCFKCRAGGNQLDLAAHYFRLEASEIATTALHLCQHLQIELPRQESLGQLGPKRTFF